MVWYGEEDENRSKEGKPEKAATGSWPRLIHTVDQLAENASAGSEERSASSDQSCLFLGGLGLWNRWSSTVGLWCSNITSMLPPKQKADRHLLEFFIVALSAGSCNNASRCSHILHLSPDEARWKVQDRQSHPPNILGDRLGPCFDRSGGGDKRQYSLAFNITGGHNVVADRCTSNNAEL